MSFSLDVKTDILNYNSNDEAADKLEIESMIRVAGEIGILPVKLTLSSNNSGIIRRFLSLIKKYYKVDTNILKRVIDSYDDYNWYSGMSGEEYEEMITDDSGYLQNIPSWLENYITIDYESMASDDDIYDSGNGVLVRH